MTQEHPIAPPRELVDRLQDLGNLDAIELAYQAGADQEMEACVEWVSQWCSRWPDGTRPEDELRAARRPKPPSLAEQALTVLERTMVLLMPVTGPEKIKQFDTIRTALERLQALEQVSNEN